MVGRRGFLGQIIGLIAGTQIPWIAEEAPFKTSNTVLGLLED